MLRTRHYASYIHSEVAYHPGGGSLCLSAGAELTHLFICRALPWHTLPSATTTKTWTASGSGSKASGPITCRADRTTSLPCMSWIWRNSGKRSQQFILGKTAGSHAPLICACQRYFAFTKPIDPDLPSAGHVISFAVFITCQTSHNKVLLPNVV